jgi:hypothetical protein
MVSNQKIRFFVQRIEAIERKKWEEIEKKYPEIKTDYMALIVQGKGKLKTEKEIRETISSVSRYQCPPMVEVLSLFSFNGEREKAKKAEESRRDKMVEEKTAFTARIKDAMDLVYFGTDEQLMKAIRGLEA